jgi:RHS repeat-associated protein
MKPHFARIAMDKLAAAARLCFLLGLMIGPGAANAATTLTATPASVIPGGTETATWSGIPSPTGSDWLGLYTPGAANTSYHSWRWGNGAASGSLPFTIPAGIAPGTYELRLLANGGYTALATSNTFTVGSTTVSGTVTAGGSPLAGVAFAATNGGSCTNSNGSGQYTCTVPQGWSGTVTPSLGSYSFTPPSRNYSNVTTAQTAQNYTASAPPVTLNVTPANVAQGGVVTATWSGIAAPTAGDWLALYVPGTFNHLAWRYTTGAASGNVPFTIPASIAAGTYELRLLANNGSTILATSNTFTINVSVSGTVTVGGSPLPGIAFTASNGGTCTASNASGQYSCSVPPGWSGSVTPTPGSHVYTPVSRSYSNVTVHQTGQNFTATVAYQVSGTVTVGGSPLAGVAFAATNGGTCTSSNASGQYSCTVASGWSGAVTPTLAPHTFSPASRNYSNVTAHQTAQNYASVTFQVSGTVTAGGSPLAGVAFAASNGVSCTNSNASGQYSCTVLQGWSGDVTPLLTGYIFTPGWRTYATITANQTAQDYTAAPAVQVSGTVTLNAAPLANVAFGASNGGSCYSTNASGQYSCTVPQGWSGAVTPWLTGYTFTPVSRNHSNVTGALTGQDFTATEGGGPAAMFFIHADHLNSPRLITNQAGQAVWRWDQTDPFGGNVANENPSGLGTFTYNLRFPGQYFDNETNLHYNYFRDYDPSTGRYGESDPIGLRGGLNTYLYVNGNPIGGVDPYGLYACDCRLEFSSFGYKERRPHRLCEYKCRCWCGPEHSGPSKTLSHATEEGPRMFGLRNPPPCILDHYNPSDPSAGNALVSFDTAYTRWNPFSPWDRAAQQFHDSMDKFCKDCPQ